MSLAAGMRIGIYEIVAPLGSGGMGEVYLANDTRLQRKVAIKFLRTESGTDEEAKKRLLREAQAAAKLEHPNICATHEVGEAQGRSFIVMQYAEGETLAARMARKPLDIRAALAVATQVAEALAEAHRHGIVHRDIKPQNIMLSAREQVKVLDFGLAKFTTTPVEGDAVTASLLADTGLIAGTVPYMSPEQVRGEELDSRSDVFSFGSVLHEIVTGKHPFAGSSAADTMSAILTREPPALTGGGPAVPAELRRIVRKCLEKDAERRYQSTHDLLLDLRNLKRDADEHSSGAAVSEARRRNLPEQLTSFIGRGHEIAEVRGLCSSTRLVTLTGAGGCGKTRLALQVAANLSDQFSDGVWTVDLAPLSEPALVTQTVASALDVREGQNRSLIEALSDYLRPRQLLLLLDNCEHLITACAQLVETLLRAAPRLHILVTSREALGVDGEAVWRVPSLALPDPAQPLAAETVSQCEAVHLFVDRARLVQPAFAVTESNAKTVAEICRRLDGIPLAIELGAARLKVLSVEQIHARLEDRFRLLTGGSRTALARQRTLEAAMNWSYELLSEVERQLLCRLSVFPGGWTLEAAEDVCAGDGLDTMDILDLLSHLVDKSLVIVDDSATGDRRHRFLETVRQYGREHLLQSGEAAQWRDRHLAFFEQLARRAEPELRAADQVAWLNRLQIEHDNLRTALEWCLAAPGRGTHALELASALFWFWTKRGYFSEGQQSLERALAGAAEVSPALRAKALIGLSHMTYFQGDYARTQILLEESLTLARESGDMGSTAFSLGMQGLVAMERGDFETSAMLAAECETAAMASGDVWFQIWPLGIRAFGAIHDGDYKQASELFEQLLSLAHQTGDKWLLGILLFDLTGLRVLQKQHAEAKALVAEGILLYQELADRRGTAWCLEALAAVEAAQARFARAVRLWGAAEALLEGLGSPPLPGLLSGWIHDYLKVTRESLGERAFQAALSEGRAMSLKQAIQYALANES